MMTRGAKSRSEIPTVGSPTVHRRLTKPARYGYMPWVPDPASRRGSLALMIPGYHRRRYLTGATSSILYPPLRTVRPDSQSEVGAEAHLRRLHPTVLPPPDPFLTVLPTPGRSEQRTNLRPVPHKTAPKDATGPGGAGSGARDV
eukprot:9436438-Pyramimonas_sp.AAC.1